MIMKNTQGFTLIELLVTVAVVIVLLVMGVPEYQRMTENNRQVSAINSIVGDLNLARSEAVKQGRTVTLCASNDGATCNTSNWEAGWIVFTDLDRDNVVDAGIDVLLSRNGALPSGLTLRTLDFDNDSVVQYLPNGEVRDTDGDDDSDGTFKVCESKNNDPKLARAANVSNLGRVSIARDTDATSDQIRNDINGNNITCP
jgi:type IV fimbrial biogenesis protein FimT